MKAVVLAGGFGTLLSEEMAFRVTSSWWKSAVSRRLDPARGEDWMPSNEAAKQVLS